jgi:hypothetical protein
MPLPSSGQISLDQIHVEAGGTTSTTASINDADIRGLITKSAGIEMAFSEWYGASAQSIVANLGLTAGLTYSDSDIDPIFAVADVSLNFYSNGSVTISRFSQSDGPTVDFLETTGAGEADNFYIKWQCTGTDPTAFGTENTYYQLNTTRTVSMGVTRSSIGSTTINTGLTDNLTITIAEDSGGTGAVTWSGDLRATAEVV